MSEYLDWPNESATVAAAPENKWSHAGSNLCLDFHGDPCRAQLAVFSDGNHHMALEQSCQQFVADQVAVDDVFYATTPPGVLLKAIQHNGLSLGNLRISRQPDVFIGPRSIINSLVDQGLIDTPYDFMRSKGQSLIVAKDNPKNITGLDDLIRDDVRLFISNPKTETASFEVYRQTIMQHANQSDRPTSDFTKLFADNSTTVFGQLIHHREAPQALYDGRADVAVVYAHLALRYSRIFTDKITSIPLQPDAQHPAITTHYSLGIMNKANSIAEQFVEFMLSEKVTGIYESHGLERP